MMSVLVSWAFLLLTVPSQTFHISTTFRSSRSSSTTQLYAKKKPANRFVSDDLLSSIDTFDEVTNEENVEATNEPDVDTKSKPKKDKKLDKLGLSSDFLAGLDEEDEDGDSSDTDISISKKKKKDKNKKKKNSSAEVALSEDSDKEDKEGDEEEEAEGI